LSPLLQPEPCPTCRGWVWDRLCDPSGAFCVNPTPCPQCGKAGPLADIIVIDTWGPGGEMHADDPLEAIAAAHAFGLYRQLGPTRSLGKLAAWMEAMDGPLPDGVLMLAEG
jgi:hypothetical protein